MSSYIQHVLPDPPTLSPVALRDPQDTATLARRLRTGWDNVLGNFPPDSPTRDYSVYTGACMPFLPLMYHNLLLLNPTWSCRRAYALIA